MNDPDNEFDTHDKVNSNYYVSIILSTTASFSSSFQKEIHSINFEGGGPYSVWSFGLF